jgi:acyl-CoA thioesterase-1
MRDALIYHVASGQAFFTGVALITLAVLLALRPTNRWRSLGRTIAACAGLLLIASSATPLPAWFSPVVEVLTLAWIVAESSARARFRIPRPWLRGGVLAAWWMGLALELPYHRMPDVPRLDSSSLAIVGDSISAGMGGEAVTWPKLLAHERGVVVHDLAQAGATVAGAGREQAGRLPGPGTLVLAEIGGNDILGGTEPEAFERSLDALLTRLRSDDRVVVMLELPLPPFFNRYGAAQRRQARLHGVLLVPKRVLLDVLTTRGATLDTIHLSRAGHVRMAEAIWHVVRPAFERRG